MHITSYPVYAWMEPHTISSPPVQPLLTTASSKCCSRKRCSAALPAAAPLPSAPTVLAAASAALWLSRRICIICASQEAEARNASMSTAGIGAVGTGRGTAGAGGFVLLNGLQRSVAQLLLGAGRGGGCGLVLQGLQRCRADTMLRRATGAQQTPRCFIIDPMTSEHPAMVHHGQEYSIAAHENTTAHTDGMRLPLTLQLVDQALSRSYKDSQHTSCPAGQGHLPSQLLDSLRGIRHHDVQAYVLGDEAGPLHTGILLQIVWHRRRQQA